MNGQETLPYLNETYQFPSIHALPTFPAGSFHHWGNNIGPLNTFGATFSNRAVQPNLSMPMSEATFPHRKSYDSIISPSFRNSSIDIASSLTSYSPPLASTSPVMSDTPSLSFDNPTFEDPLMMLHWLSEVEISRLGYSKIRQTATAQKILPKLERHKNGIPTMEHFSRIEEEFMEAVRRKNHQRVPFTSSSSATELYIPQNRNRRPDVLSTPKDKRPTSSAIPSSPKSPSAPRVPYKGRFGSNPVCGSCKSSKTPYWRDSWSNAFILCNACGLRYSKFKRYCNECAYVPRKEDKSTPCCAQCSSPWSYKV